MVVSHEISDYDKFIDAITQSPAQDGLQDRKIYRTTDGGRVVVIDTFDTVENAEKLRAFLDDPANKPIGEGHGVVFPITIWIAEAVS